MKSVLIIGGCCDIGKLLVDYFLDKKYNVVVGYHNNKEKKENVKYIKCDILNEDDIENIVKFTKEMYGNIDMIINLSCIYIDNDFLSKTKEEFMKVLEVNLVGTFLCNKIYSKYIDDGIIVNMASTDGIDTYSSYSIDYSASKAGIINISKSISLATNNKILCIAPNWIDTSSTMCMDTDYLKGELIRIGQDRLITREEFIVGFDKIINSDFNSGDVFRIDIKGDKLWVEKM